MGLFAAIVALAGVALSGVALTGCAMNKPAPASSAPPLPVVYLLFFPPSSADLTQAAKIIIDQAAAKVRDRPPSTVTLAGYTTGAGTPTGQKEMAERRIKVVEAALVADGVDPKLFLRIPLGDVDDSAGKTGDRRIEIRLTYDKP
jgi:outer membrane protein OmpA-like peptidoglycan-associated protein